MFKSDDNDSHFNIHYTKIGNVVFLQGQGTVQGNLPWKTVPNHHEINTPWNINYESRQTLIYGMSQKLGMVRTNVSDNTLWLTGNSGEDLQGNDVNFFIMFEVE